jgi:hypothetical protein
MHKTAEHPETPWHEMHYNMFDLDHEMHQSKFKSFDNVKIMNGKIMQQQVREILNAHNRANTREL